VGDALAGAGARVAVTGTPDEAEVVGAVASAMRSPALELAGAVSLAGLAGLLADAAVVVANDSGPLHLAGAVGAATVGVYWCGILPAAGPLTLTRHRPLVSWRLACPVCGREGIDAGCEHRASFVADVPPAEAVAHALDLLARDGARGGRARRSADPATPDR
jgi:ADP-heptose:LPS heptosyltransferase